VLAAVIAFGVLLFLMPFYDRSKRRTLSQRPVYAAIGSILIVELITLTIWGYLTPGRIIPNYQAVLVLFGLAAVTAVVVLSVYRFRGKMKAANPQAPSIMPIQSTSDSPVQSKVSALRKKRLVKDVKNAGESILNKFTAVFVVFLAVASVSLASAVNMLPNILANTPFIVVALAAFVVSSFFMCIMLRKFVLAYEEAVAKR
jgi:quinol-cytochrome oxidoreductase complex cytochrome b subunit